MRFLVRTDPSEPIAGDADVVLDWLDDRHRSTVQYDKPERPFLAGLSPSPLVMDLLRLGGAVFCADKVASREDTPDLWTRDLKLSLPVSDPDRWNGAAALVHEALTFLSGDDWTISFTAGALGSEQQPLQAPEADAVALFSGGLDSLAGAIELLEAGKRLVLVGHHDSPLTDHTQTALFSSLRSYFPAHQFSQRRLFLRPAPSDSRQARPLPGAPEITTRTRSLLFLAAGVAVADGIGAQIPLQVPENGFIGLNVPLTAARVGSLSTRTTHPYFMQKIAALLSALGLQHTLENPFRLATKGEALAGSSRRDIIETMAPASVSCSHPEAARWHEGLQGNCGYCYPCMIRRASLHRIGADSANGYDRDVLSDVALLQSSRLKAGRDLRALLTRLGQPARVTDILRNGRIPDGETRSFFDLYRRGRQELLDWFNDGGSPEILTRLG